MVSDTEGKFSRVCNTPQKLWRIHCSAIADGQLLLVTLLVSCL